MIMNIEYFSWSITVAKYKDVSLVYVSEENGDIYYMLLDESIDEPIVSKKSCMFDFNSYIIGKYKEDCMCGRETENN